MVDIYHLQNNQMPAFWRDDQMPAHFETNALPHRHFNHALTHAMKALGKLAALSDALDHSYMAKHGNFDQECAELEKEAQKYLADLVICTVRMAQQRNVDLDAGINARLAVLIERWAHL